MREVEIPVPAGRNLRPDEVKRTVARTLRLGRSTVISVYDPTCPSRLPSPDSDIICVISRRSLDARSRPVMRYRVEVYDSSEGWKPYAPAEYRDVHGARPVIVVGSGPAGMFSSLKLLTLGLRPIILERGRDVHSRKLDNARLSREGILNPDSNYCFGEGGAGTFSDGKLYTRSSKRGDNREVLYQLVRFGASPSILLDSHPHIGTDKLPAVVENIRHCIEEYGGEYHFDSKADGFRRLDNGSFEVHCSSGETFCGDRVILATGHSARDIYELLRDGGCTLEAKGFALGVRVEHPRHVIDNARYHGDSEGLPSAEYSFVKQVDGRGVFSFCMCPGGILVPSSTEPGTVVLNGMSNSARNSRWSNAGVVVSVEPEDVPDSYRKDGPFALLNFQRDVEKRMYEYSGSFAAPAQRMTDFCSGHLSESLPETSYHPGVVSAPLHDLLPSGVSSRLRKVFPEVNSSISGYFTSEALLLGVESRTSSPVRIPRDAQTLESPDIPGLYPCGEGAGYSGGIVSSAIDGIRCAVAAAASICGGEKE